MRLNVRNLCFALLLGLCTNLLHSGDLQTVRLQLKWKHQFQFAGYYAAVEKGYYRDTGLKVEILEAQSDKTPFEAVYEGKAEFGTCTTDILTARSEGLNPVVLANIFQHSPHIIITKQESGIRFVHDLVGKKIAAEPGAADLSAFLLSEGIALNRFTVVEPDYSMVRFKRGEVDAITAYSTDEIFPLRQAGYKLNILWPSSSGIDFYGDLLFTSAEMIKKNPKLVERFTQASLQGWHYALDHQGETVDIIYNKYSKRHSKEHLRFEAAETEKLILHNVVEIGYTNPGRWDSILDSYKKVGRVKASLTNKGLLYKDYQKQKVRISKRIILIFLGALLIAYFLVYFFYRVGKKLRKEIHQREIIQQQLAASDEEIKRKNADLIKINAEKDRFFSIIAHDLRSPFNAFLGISQLLAEKIDKLNQDEIKVFALNLYQSAEKLYRLLENLLEWSRIERGLIQPKPQVFSISTVVEEIRLMFRESAQIKELTITTEMPDDLQVLADYQMTQTILRNLLSNAVKFTPRKGKITVSAQPSEPGYVAVTIADTGIGMDEGLMQDLYKLDAVTSRPGTEGELSSGLGLVLCKELVELNGGILSVVSEVDKGSAFTFSLKLADENG